MAQKARLVRTPQKRRGQHGWLTLSPGEAPFPSDLTETDRRTLADEVRRLRRKRLLKFLARSIAADIVRVSRLENENDQEAN
jgi:hypothetical protein